MPETIPIRWRCRRCGRSGRVVGDVTTAGLNLALAKAAALSHHGMPAECPKPALSLEHALFVPHRGETTNDPC